SGPKGLRLDLEHHAFLEEIKAANALSVSTWFLPENLKQEGPARIFTISKSSSERNFTIGQEGNQVEVRLRTTSSGKNGTPGLKSRGGSLRTEWTHAVFTWQDNGEAILYLNGEEAARKKIEGDLSNWDLRFGVGIGDELSGGRPWHGVIRDVSVYQVALSRSEVEQLFDEGPGSASSGMFEEEVEPINENVELFETKVTTILTQHCLECHDSSTAKGKLDLSRKLASHWEDGLLVAGKSSDSLFWESIEYDDMPHDRPPLSVEEKEVIRQWIDGGAEWNVAFIDPAIYSRPAEAAPPWSRRLTKREYIATVRDTFGVDLGAEASELLPEDVRADGFHNTAYNLTVDLEHVEAYSALADKIGSLLDVRTFANRFSSKRDLTDKTMIALIEAMGEWVLRGPLDREEKALYRGISTTVASAGGDFDDAVRYVIVAMSQSPRFLYRVEEPPRGQQPRPVDAYELASRLSYLVWGSSPDEALLASARSGRLRSDEEIGKQVRRMVSDPRAKEQSLDFFSQWLHLSRLDHLSPSEDHFPEWDPTLAQWMKKETLAFVEEVIWNRKEPVSALLNADVTFLNEPLARHYGLDLELPDEKLEKVSLETVKERGGLLTQGSVLTVGGDEASMVSRGLFVLNDLLRGVVKDPPPGVDLEVVLSKPGLTQRGIAIERISDKACGGCHERFEPLAFGLERFDGLGTFLETDAYGNELREDGEVLIPGEAKPKPYQTIDELMDLLAESARVRETISWKLVQFAMGRPLNARDAAEESRIHERGWEAGGRYTDLLEAVATSDLIRYAAPEPPSPKISAR
ncbi:MAG: DUF1592 domain-containing protein, partial [Verrucomicrobiota bacterium]